MSEPRSDRYWSKIKRSISLSIVLFILYAVAYAVRGVSGESDLQFSEFPVVSTLALVSGLVWIYTGLGFCYFASKDKSELAKEFEGARTRHWITIGIFLYFTSGIYGLWYLYQRRKYPRAPSSEGHKSRHGIIRLSRLAFNFLKSGVAVLYQYLIKNDQNANEPNKSPENSPARREKSTSQESSMGEGDLAGQLSNISILSENGPVHEMDGEYPSDDGGKQVRIYALDADYLDEYPNLPEVFQTEQGKWDGISKNTHVAELLESGNDERPWLAFSRGASTFDNRLETMNTEMRVEIVADVSEAIRTASMYNLSHSALSPSVIFLHDEPNGTSVTVADWGLRRSVNEFVEESSITPYTAPEQITGESAGSRTDIYQLGVLGYHAVCGSPPFEATGDTREAILNSDFPPVSERNTSVGPNMDTVIHRAMEPDPQKRFDSPYKFQRQFVDAFN